MVVSGLLRIPCLHAPEPLPDLPAVTAQQPDLPRDAQQRHAERAPYVQAIAAHGPEGLPAFPVHAFSSSSARAHSVRRSRSSSSVRARARATAMAYIQAASAMTSMPHSIVSAIDGARARLTDAPWCRVFHHFTEK